MKKLLYFFLFILISFNPEKSSAAQQYYYVVFDNLDVITNTEGQVISNAFDQLYYDPINKYPFDEYLIKLPFSDATFANYNITNFDIAVFPMGDKPLNYSTSGGITVLSKIKEMEAAGKRVVIIGRSLLWNAFQTQPNQQVQQFFYEYLGVDEVFKVNLINGQYYQWFTINGVTDDSLANGTRKWGNFIRGENGIEPAPPWRYATELEAFKVRPDDWRFTPIDWFSKVSDDIEIIRTPMTDTIMGVRSYTPNNSKMVFWCYGTEFLCSVGSIPRHCTELWYAFNWLLDNYPKIGPYLMAVPNPIQFGGVQINTYTIRKLVITNFGRQVLEVEDIYIDETYDPGTFEIIGSTAFSIQPLDTHSIFVKFAPTVEGTYLEYLTFTSNSGGHTSDFIMELKGTGGKDAEQGPIIDVVSSVNFGEVKIGKFDTLAISINSIGTAPLYLIKNDFIDRGNNSFDYNKESDSKSGFMIPPDSTYKFTVRYIPQEAGRLDSGLIKLETNQKGGGAFSYIKLYGRGAAAIPKLLLSTTIIDFDTVLTGHNNETDVILKNTGTSDLIIDSISFIRNDSSAFSITEGGTYVTPLTIKPSEENTLKIQFTPVLPIMYNATIQINSNFAENPNYKIYISGIGLQDTVGVDEEFGFAGNELFSMKAVPNPNYGKAVVDYVLKGDKQCMVEIFLVDMLGNRISTFINSNQTPGDYRLEMDIPSAKLSSGTYYIIANVADLQARLPIVILK